MFVPFEHFIEAVETLFSIRDKFAHLVQITETRMCKGDKILMSPCFGSGDFIGIHFTWKRQFEEVVKAITHVEGALEKFNAKPHPGKLFTLNGLRFEQLYGAQLTDFRKVILRLHPAGKFRNELTDQSLFNGQRPVIKLAKL